MIDPRVSDMSPADLDDVERIAAEGFRPPWTRAHVVEELGRAVSRCRVARAEPGAPVLSASPSGVRENVSFSRCVRMPKLASVRMNRCSARGFVFVGAARSAADFGPLAR